MVTVKLKKGSLFCWSFCCYSGICWCTSVTL